MKKISKFILICFYIASTTAMAEDVDLHLEPCINGGVSETGEYPNQAVEDELVEKQRIKKQKALEPSINVDPSVSVIYPKQK